MLSALMRRVRVSTASRAYVTCAACCALLSALSWLPAVSQAQEVEAPRPAPMRVVLVALGQPQTAAQRAVEAVLRESEGALVVRDSAPLWAADANLRALETIEAWAQLDAARLGAALAATDAEALLLVEVREGDVRVATIGAEAAPRGLARVRGVAEGWTSLEARPVLQRALGAMAPEVLRARRAVAGVQAAALPEPPKAQPDASPPDAPAPAAAPPRAFVEAPAPSHTLSLGLLFYAPNSSLNITTPGAPTSVGSMMFGARVLADVEPWHAWSRRLSLGLALDFAFAATGLAKYNGQDVSDLSLASLLIRPTVVGRYRGRSGLLVSAHVGAERDTVFSEGREEFGPTSHWHGRVEGRVGVHGARGELTLGAHYARTLAASESRYGNLQSGDGFGVGLLMQLKLSASWGLMGLIQWDSRSIFHENPPLFKEDPPTPYKLRLSRLGLGLGVVLWL